MREGVLSHFWGGVGSWSSVCASAPCCWSDFALVFVVWALLLFWAVVCVEHPCHGRRVGNFLPGSGSGSRSPTPPPITDIQAENSAHGMRRLSSVRVRRSEDRKRSEDNIQQGSAVKAPVTARRLSLATRLGPSSWKNATGREM